jgi:hypothetical protein
MPGPEPWEYAFEREMNEQLEARRAQLIEGGAADYAQYRELCGQIRGIQICMAEVKRIHRRLANPDGDVDFASEGL